MHSKRFALAICGAMVLCVFAQSAQADDISPTPSLTSPHTVLLMGLTNADLNEIEAEELDSSAQSRKNSCPNNAVCLWKDASYESTTDFRFPCTCAGGPTYTEHHMTDDGFNDEASSFYNRWGAGYTVFTDDDRYYDPNGYYTYNWQALCTAPASFDSHLSTTSSGNMNDIISMEKYNRDYSCFID
jgi:hypothetical protein